MVKRLSNISIYIVIMLILFRGFVFAASATLYANGDITTANWTLGTCATNLFNCISEGTVNPNDTNFIQTTNGVTNGDYVFTSTSSPGDTSLVSAITITVRAVATGGRTATLAVFYSTDGSDPAITIGTQQTLTQTLNNYTFTATGLSLSKAQIDNLRIKFRANASSSGPGGNTAVQVTASQTDITYTSGGPASTNYQLLDYGFGAGGVASASSANYLMQGILGEVETASLSSQNYLALPGLTYALEPNTPNAPTFTNPSNYYNKLNIVIDNGGNPSDTTFTIQVSTDNFTSNKLYVQADHTLGLSPVFQDYTTWGGASGFNIIGLSGGTTYYARVAAKRGTFQQERFSATATATTTNATLTFNVQTSSQASPPFVVGIGVVTPGQITTSWQKVTTTISTNAATGGLVYIYGTNNGLKSTNAGNYTIASATNNLNGALEGYGAQGTTVSQTSGGPMEIISPYNGSGESVGAIDTNKRILSDSTSQPVTGGQTTFQLKAKASNTTPSATDYADTITLIGTGSF